MIGSISHGSRSSHGQLPDGNLPGLNLASTDQIGYALIRGCSEANGLVAVHLASPRVDAANIERCRPLGVAIDS
jgi:hypothetical protein